MTLFFKPLPLVLAIVIASVAQFGNASEITEPQALYDSHCAACHNLGVAGAPKVGDKEAWQSRLEQGNTTLYKHAINGFTGELGVMPPKGGFVNLTDEQIKTIVEYMVSRVQ